MFRSLLLAYFIPVALPILAPTPAEAGDFWQRASERWQRVRQPFASARRRAYNRGCDPDAQLRTLKDFVAHERTGVLPAYAEPVAVLGRKVRRAEQLVDDAQLANHSAARAKNPILLRSSELQTAVIEPVMSYIKASNEIGGAFRYACENKQNLAGPAGLKRLKALHGEIERILPVADWLAQKRVVITHARPENGLSAETVGIVLEASTHHTLESRAKVRQTMQKFLSLSKVLIERTQ